MIKTKIEIDLFYYNELNEEAKEIAFANHYDFLASIPVESESLGSNGEIIVKKEFIESWSQEEIRDYVEESLEINEYLFFSNGEMARTTTFVGNHEKRGITELYLFGKTFIVRRELVK